MEKRTTAAARQLLYAAWSPNGFRDTEQAERWRARAAGWLTDYVPTLDPTDEPVGNERTVGATAETNDVPSTGEDIVTHAWPRMIGTSSPEFGVPRFSMMNFDDVALTANELSTFFVV